MNQRHSPRRVALFFCLCALVAVAVFVSPSSSGQEGRARVRQDVGRALEGFDELTLDPAAVSKQVRETGRLSLRTTHGTFELELEASDVRAENYRAVVMEEGGARELGRAPARTFKGTVRGLEGAQARFSIDAQKLEGLIATRGGELYFVEAAKNYSTAAGKSDFIFYPESSVRAESFGECGTTLAHRVGERAGEVAPGGTDSGSGAAAATTKGIRADEIFGPKPEVEVATEGDFEFFQTFGTAEAANADILDVMNQVDGIYDVQLGIKMRVVFQRTWAVAADPYSGTAASAALDQFRTVYDGSFAPGSPPARDLTHMWTGRDFNGGTIGIAYIASVCESPAFSYGMSQNAFGAGAPQRVGLTAHEMGHNFSAEHPDQENNPPAGCSPSIMNSSITTSTNFCQFSRDQITNHTASKGGCLTRLTQPGCTYAVSPSYRRFAPAGGSSTVNVATSQPGCAWAVAEGAPWLTVTSGEAASGFGVTTFSVAPNAGGPVSAQMDIAGQKVTVAQDASPNCATTPTDGDDAGVLVIGDCASGQPERVSALADLWTFQGIAGQRIRVEMNAAIPPNGTGTGLDTFLYLFGPDGTVVAENDDIVLGSQTNSRIPVNGFFVLPQTGTYIIETTSFDDVENNLGPYSLVVTAGNPNNETSIAGGGSLTVSEGTGGDGIGTEGTGFRTISVSRSNATGAASVDYATSNGTANSTSDYTAALGTLNFAPGEVTKSFAVFITDDAFDDDNETINITLSNPVGTTLGTAASAVLVINDNDAANGPSPVRPESFNTRFFVRQHYLDFLGREPDAGGMGFWSNGIDICGPDPVCQLNKRVDTSAAFFLSIEFQETGFLVHRMYKAAYGDAVGQATQNGVPIQIPVPVVRFHEFLPDTQRIGKDVIVGSAGWPERLNANKTAFAQEFVSRARFVAEYPAGMTPEQFVDKLITNAAILIETSERNALVAEVAANNNATGRGSVLRKIAEDPELASIETNKAFVLMQFFGYLRRNPNDPPDATHGGYNFWLGKLNDNNGDFRAAQMVLAFLDSVEYKQRFGQP
ncbi:MAG TPA: M12 family metallo-peptidase [Pyrinomonadaceae bacterium]|nr:M12 family metallo-peptidase [Pyrinomonadaceae bacterium]